VLGRGGRKRSYYSKEEKRGTDFQEGGSKGELELLNIGGEICFWIGGVRKPAMDEEVEKCYQERPIG